MTKQTTLTLTDDRQRLEDRLREEIPDDRLPDQQFRGPLVTMAYRHLLDSLRNAKEVDTDVCHDCKIAFNTSVVKHRTSTSVEVKRP